MKSVILILLGLAVGLVCFVGCGSDSSTSPTKKIAGDTTDPQFQAASSAFGMADQFSGDFILGSFDFINQINAPAAKRTLDTIEYHPLSKYWYRQYTSVDTTYNYTPEPVISRVVDWVMVESLQFVNGSTPMMFPDSATLSALHYGVRALAHDQLSADSINITQRMSMVGQPGSLWARGDVEVSGTGRFQAGIANEEAELDSTAWWCDIAMNLTETYDAVALNLTAVMDNGDCPTGGTITRTGSLAIGCANSTDTLNFSGQWTASAAFNNGEVTWRFENPTTYWTKTETCGPKAVARNYGFEPPKE